MQAMTGKAVPLLIIAGLAVIGRSKVKDRFFLLKFSFSLLWHNYSSSALYLEGVLEVGPISWAEQFTKKKVISGHFWAASTFRTAKKLSFNNFVIHTCITYQVWVYL